jgi:hypothetical protein
VRRDVRQVLEWTLIGVVWMSFVFVFAWLAVCGGCEIFEKGGHP